MEKRAHNPKELVDTPYSHAIVSGGTFYMSGQVARNANGDIVGEDNLETQSRKVFDNIETLLDEIDKELSNITKVTVQIRGEQETLEGYKRVYQEKFDDPYPCQTVIPARRIGDSPVMLEIEAEVPLE
jgi:enamine deaminase RidA (YjgF/YER057c/UK114 family)